MLPQPHHEVSLVVMDTWYGAQRSLKNKVRNNPMSLLLLTWFEKTKILKMSNFHQNICQSYHKNNVTHHPFPHHTINDFRRKKIVGSFLHRWGQCSLISLPKGRESNSRCLVSPGLFKTSWGRTTGKVKLWLQHGFLNRKLTALKNV